MMKALFFVFLVVLAAPVLGGDIKGVVYIDCGGAITDLAGLSVVATTIDGSTFPATTDADGTFVIHGLPDSGSAAISVTGMPEGILPFSDLPGGVYLSSNPAIVDISLDDAIGLEVPAYYETQCGTLDPSVTGEAVSTGFCPGTITYSDTATLTNYYLLTYRTWMLTVGSNTLSGLQLMKSQDTEPPVLTVPPPPSNTECNGSVPPPAQTATVTDNCSGGMQAEYIDVVDMGCPIKVTRTWMVADLSGNIATSTQTFELVDTTPPRLISRAPDYQGPCGAPAEEWFYNYGGAVFEDACYPTLALSANSATCTNGTIASFTATDACGNQNIDRAFVAYTEHCDSCP